MKRILACFIGFVLLMGNLNARTPEVPERVKGLLLKTGASW